MAENIDKGILNVLKPPGMTSHDVVSFLRRKLNIKKVGHAGTLDPGAAGVLPVCLGKATKAIEYMTDDIKEYRAELTLGRTTVTQDGFGDTLRVVDASGVKENDVESVLYNFIGKIEQVPPMVSAIKHKGKKLYELARKGIEIERKPRNITIFKLRIIKFSCFGTPEPKILFDIKCSKGTYVRTICNDIGEKLGCGGYMSFLIRTGSGIFRLSDAVTLEEISEMADEGSINDVLYGVDKVLPFEAAWVKDNVVEYVLRGNRILLSGVSGLDAVLREGQYVKLMNKYLGCLAVAKVNIYKNQYFLQPVKVFS